MIGPYRNLRHLVGNDDGIFAGLPLAVQKAISEAANSHDELVEALRAYLSARPQCECSPASGCEIAEAREMARAALAKARQP